jgi:glycerol kinase
LLAGLATGIWTDAGEIKALRVVDNTFEPGMDREQLDSLVAGWQLAVSRTRYKPEKS